MCSPQRPLRRRPPRADAETVLRNIAALAQFTNPTRLPPFPPWRSWVLMRAMWRAYRIPTQRPWLE